MDHIRRLLPPRRDTGEAMKDKTIKTKLIDECLQELKSKDNTLELEDQRNELANQINFALKMVEFVDKFGECSLLYAPKLKTKLLATSVQWNNYMKAVQSLMTTWIMKDGTIKNNQEANQFLIRKTRLDLEAKGYPAFLFDAMSVPKLQFFPEANEIEIVNNSAQ